MSSIASSYGNVQLIASATADTVEKGSVTQGKQDLAGAQCAHMRNRGEDTVKSRHYQVSSTYERWKEYLETSHVLAEGGRLPVNYRAESSGSRIMLQPLINSAPVY